MTYSGYPTPDIDPSQQFQQVCITIPSSLGDVFYQVLLGQISEMANEYYWKQEGTMTPEDCAFLWSQTLALTPADLEGCTTMTCEEVADCIETDAGVQSAISNYINGVGSGGTSSGGSAGGGSNTTIVLTNNPYDFMSGGNCSNDNMYAVAVKITQLAFETVNQLYQVIDQAISPLELAAEVADNAPAVATAVPATAGDWLVWVQDTAYDSWQAFDSPTRRTDVACEIFCIMVANDCSLTFDDLFNYFADKTVTAIFGVTLESVLLDMVDVLITDEIGWTSLAFLFACLSLGSKVAGVTNVGGFMTTIAAYIDETNNNWALECDPCADSWLYCYDFSIDNQDWRGTLNSDAWLGAIRPNVATEPASIYSNPAWGEKFVTTLQTFDNQTLSQVIDDWTLAPVNVDTLTITMNYTKGQFDTNGYAWLVRYRRDGDVGFTDAPSVLNNSTTDGIAIQHTFNINDTQIAEICISIRCSINNLQSGVAEILHLEVVGNGANTPPNAIECA